MEKKYKASSPVYCVKEFDNEEEANLYRNDLGVPNMMTTSMVDDKIKVEHKIERSVYNKRKRNLAPFIEKLRRKIAAKFNEFEDVFLIDSMPLEVCKMSRSTRAKICNEDFHSAPDKGFCASQQMYFYGYKLHAICSLSGVFESIDITKASVHDIHYLKDLFTETESPENIKGLDIGVGANCIYPLLANKIYNWKMVGADTDTAAIASARANVKAAEVPKDSIEIRHQLNRANIFEGIISEKEYFHFSMCNPPFHTSEEEAVKGTLRKLRNLGDQSPRQTKKEIVL